MKLVEERGSTLVTTLVLDLIPCQDPDACLFSHTLVVQLFFDFIKQTNALEKSIFCPFRLSGKEILMHVQPVEDLVLGKAFIEPLEGASYLC